MEIGIGIAIAFITGVVTGTLVPFTVYYYRRTRTTQGMYAKPVGAQVYQSRSLATPSPSLAGDDTQVFLTNIGFRMVPERRRVGRKPQRPQPRRTIVR